MIEFGPQNTVSKLFLKNVFSFSRYRPSKSGTSAGSILGFTRFPKIIIRNLRLWCHKWSKLHNQYRAQWLTWLQSKWKLLSLMVFGRNYGSLCCLWLLNDSRKTKGISSQKFQADNQRMQAVTTNDLMWRASSSKTTPNLIVRSLEVMQYQPISFFALTNIKVGWGKNQRSAVSRVTYYCTEVELELTHMA